jgi:FKBP-type peptidyl-prolyl cis-trans isomerase FkpA
MKTLNRAFVFACLFTAAACNAGEQPTAPITFVGPPNLVSTDLSLGTGAAASVGQSVTVHYSMWLYDPAGQNGKGVLMASSLASAPITIRLTTGTVITGWVEGVPGMKVGGQRRLTIPPSLAYGPTGFQAVPPNAWLVFEIELLGVSD